MTRIFDNIHNQLGTHLQATLQEFDRLDVAVGYFNLRGWSAFDDLVREKVEPGGGGKPVARILIGMVTGGPQQEALDSLQSEVDDAPSHEADNTAARARRDQLLEQLRVQLMRGLPTAADRSTLRSLRDLLAEGKVEVKVFTRRPLHGKTYVFHRQDLNTPIIGFVGSSNLTAPGLTSNLELNVDVVDSAASADLAQWFEDRWNDRFSRPVTTELLDLIDESWATPEPRRPYEVFLKVCYDLSRDVRDGEAEYSIPPEIASLLLDYQTTAVRTLARRIVTRGGTMLGDVVGLGKTLTAIAVALMLRDEHGYMPLVVCPKNLVRMWEEHLGAYDLHGKVVPYSMVHNVLPELRRYPFVIVDESHTLRNNERRDYAAIRDYIRANDSKVLGLTATPYNIQFTDVANQLGLYIEEDDDLGISPTNALAADPQLRDKVDGKISTLAAFRRSEDPDDWKRLMSEHLVRRTRSFIRSNYTAQDEHGRDYLEFADGTRFTFPDRVARPLAHDFGASDPARAMASDEALATIDALSLPRYDLARYLNRSVLLTEEERAWVEDIARGRGQVAGFVKTTFYKRLSSGGYAFTLSLHRHVARNELFLYAIDKGLPVPTGTILDVNMAWDEDETTADAEGADVLGAEPARRYEALQAASPTGVTWVRPGLFTPALRDALERDTTALSELLDSFGDWDASRDSKLHALIDLLTQRHPHDKILVFTEYKDTALYVAAELAAVGITDVAAVTGASEDPTRLAHRFSPRSNSLPGKDPGVAPEDELRVLVATDVLSEGQNLQDAHIIVNYDLPWAIIRLIQRAGRVDRVGQSADEVFIYSFFHESLENVISLRRRIAARLSANAEAFGSDEQFFGTEGEVHVISDLYNGNLDDHDGTDSIDDVDASSLAFQYWSNAEKADPALAKKIAQLPDLIDATRAQRVTDREAGVVCFVRTASGIDGFGFAPLGKEPRLLTGHEALRLFEAAPTEEGLELREDHEDLIVGLVRGPLATPQAIAGRLRGVRRQVWNRLGETLEYATRSPDTQAALEALYQHPLTREAERRLRSAIRSAVNDEALAARVTALHRDDQLVIESRTSNDPIRIVSSMGIR
ncbi:helicase-related protein [Georgenia satyanarayanai]|uniref:helicase-related protein n=1 Tax=Georgenia satyanarayanai TaxID=860221 RepID=UPI00186ABD10|nr:helicase-related protein [Georgenia satyanarayanai]